MQPIKPEIIRSDANSTLFDSGQEFNVINQEMIKKRREERIVGLYNQSNIDVNILIDNSRVVGNNIDQKLKTSLIETRYMNEEDNRPEIIEKAVWYNYGPFSEIYYSLWKMV